LSDNPVAGSGPRLAVAWLGYLTLVTLLVTLAPFEFREPERFRIFFSGGVGDVLANILLFVPLGFLARLTLATTGPLSSPPGILGLGLIVSSLIETAQLFLPGRYPSPVDVVTNGIGAFLGCLVLDTVSRRIRLTPGLVNRLALELPLMGLAYLLVPLLWVSSLASRAQPGRWALTTLVGVMGAVILASLYRHRFGPAGAIRAWGISLVAGLGYLVGAIPGFGDQPELLALGTAVVSLVTGILAFWPSGTTGGERRFEGSTLNRVIPGFMIYLVLLVLWPPAPRFGGWRLGWGLEVQLGDVSTDAIFSLLEYLAAFTLLGYALAEHRGRLDESTRRLVLRSGGVGFAWAAVLELAATLHVGSMGSGLRLAMAVVAVSYGAGLYALQRAHIRGLLETRLRT
jgi:glycopeptide antibiotics resistance protein